MALISLPEAVLRERQAMIAAALRVLRDEGCGDFCASELPGFEEPADVLIPVLNVRVRPDVTAHRNGRMCIGFAEVSSDLGEEACGRRWQALADWARARGGRLYVFVHPEDHARAVAIARHWHVAPECIVPLTAS
jgi:hypothetical protein